MKVYDLTKLKDNITLNEFLKICDLDLFIEFNNGYYKVYIFDALIGDIIEGTGKTKTDAVLNFMSNIENKEIFIKFGEYEKFILVPKFNYSLYDFKL